MKLSDDPQLIEFSISISREFEVKAFRRPMLVNVRDMIHSFHFTLSADSQINDIIDYLTDCPLNIQNDMKHIGERFNSLLMESNFQKKKKKIFICNQMILHGKESGGHRYDRTSIRDALEIFSRSRNAYRALLRDYLILPCDKTLKSCFGKLGSAGSSEECKSVVKNVFSGLEGQERFCFITADEIYVKAAVRYSAGHIIGLGVDQDPPKAAKTILAFMINFLLGTSSFIDRLIPVTTLKSEFLMVQLMILLCIIHDAGGFVFLVMTDNLSVNQKMCHLLKQIHHQNSVATITHPMKNIYLKLMTLGFDPMHVLKNVRNNWSTEKTQTFDFVDPDTGNKASAKWNDLKSIYKEQADNLIQTTKLDYATLYPNNYIKQKVSLALNGFNEKTVSALKL